MNRNNRYSRSRRYAASRRRSMYIRRAIFFGTAALLLTGIIILIASLASGSKEDPAKPYIAPAQSVDPTQEPSPEPSSEPTSVPVAPELSSPSEDSAEGELTLDPLAAPTVPSDPTPAPQTNTGTGRRVHMRVLGDIMFHQEQLDMAKQPDGSYDFSLQFKYIADSIGAADYTIANLETTVGKYKNQNYSGYPQFNTPESVLTTLKDCGIDFFTLANNHMLDRWFDGMKNNVNLCEKYGFQYVGAYRTQEERNTPTIYEINGIKIGFVAYTHSTNTMEDRGCDEAVKIYGVPYLYKSDIEADIAALKKAGAEVVIALPHWGAENTHIPDSDQQKYAKKLAAAGADIILGSHSHMVEPMLTYEGVDPNTGKNRQVFCIYSMGNFISAMTLARTDNGIILDFTIVEQPDGSFRVEDIGYVPLYVWKHGSQLTVLPILKYTGANRPSVMTDDQYNRMLESYDELTGVLGTDQWRVLED